jgi:hypothetical protein
MGVIFIILLCLIMAGVVGSGVIKNTFLGIFIGLVVIIAFGFLTSWLTNTVNQRGFTPEQRDRRKAVKKCAKITSFNAPRLFDKTGQIIFQFENEHFATEFATMNLVQLV